MSSPVYWITNDTAVDRRFVRELASANNDDQRRDGWWVQLNVAPLVCGQCPSAIVFMSTSGDPVFVAAIGEFPERGDYHLSEEMGWLEENGDVPNWWLCLREFGFSGTADDNGSAVEFILDLMVQAKMIE